MIQKTTTNTNNLSSLAPIDRQPLAALAKEEILGGLHLMLDSVTIPFNKAERRAQPVTNAVRFVGSAFGGFASVLFGLGLGVAAGVQGIRSGIQHLGD
ncbi:MAG: hypothetical protein U1E65_02940 [Myxococcota bacterium]